MTSSPDISSRQTEENNMASQGLHAAVKRKYIRDYLARPTHIIEARSQAEVGEKCNYVQYGYIGTSVDVDKDREGNTTWRTDWELTVEDPQQIYPNPLAAGVYYVDKVDANTIKLATSVANAVAGTIINILSIGSRDTTATPQVFAVKTFLDSDINDTTEVITKALHGLITGTPFVLTTTGTLPGGLSLATTYYAIRTDDNNFKIASSEANAFAGTAINLTANGSGTHTLTPTVFSAKSFTESNVDASSDEITITSHGWFTGLQITLS